MKERNYMNYGIYEKLIEKSTLAGLQARRLLSDYSYWYHFIVRSIVFAIPMVIIFILVLIFGRIEGDRNA